MSNDTLNKSIFLPASRETVWSFLTEKDKLKLWFQPAEADLADKQDYALVSTGDDGSVNKICWGTVLEMDPPSRLKYSFTIKPLNGASTIVIWELEALEGGTKLSLTHEGISQAAGEAAMGLILALDKGWDDHLASLRTELS
ncbi:MAG: SRPBCC domain-containing protein [Alphaproteobacteria bacterium]|nr:SRPBCC domain-containing protein [Alphaproteobacteria bacterium]